MYNGQTTDHRNSKPNHSSAKCFRQVLFQNHLAGFYRGLCRVNVEIMSILFLKSMAIDLAVPDGP